MNFPKIHPSSTYREYAKVYLMLSPSQKITLFVARARTLSCPQEATVANSSESKKFGMRSYTN